MSTLVWVTDESPADKSGTADRAEREIGVPPPPRGSIFRVVEFPPERKEMSREAVLKEMGIAGQEGPKQDSKHAACTAPAVSTTPWSWKARST